MLHSRHVFKQEEQFMMLLLLLPDRELLICENCYLLRWGHEVNGGVVIVIFLDETEGELVVDQEIVYLEKSDRKRCCVFLLLSENRSHTKKEKQLSEGACTQTRAASLSLHYWSPKWWDTDTNVWSRETSRQQSVKWNENVCNQIQWLRSGGCNFLIKQTTSTNTWPRQRAWSNYLQD